jgi:hypothetical protein
MKIRFYKLQSEPIRWLGFTLALIGCYFLTKGVVELLWVGWSISILSCLLWTYIAIKDGDLSRSLMELIYLILAFRGMFVWF